MTDKQVNSVGFWGKLEKPIIGLSPMDGVTDAPMRFIAKKYGKPSVVYTEFVSAEGLWRIKKRGEMDHKIWKDLKYSEEDRPVVAQIFGSDPESFYEAAKIICELGFDGIDINMGCPSPGLEKRGGGAGLIRDKCNAVEVVEATRRGVDGRIPVSLKTRIGSAAPDRKWWELIASMKMPLVAMHGRTFKQLYSGYADWDLLLEAAEIIRDSGALFLGNGDISSVTVRSAQKPCSDPTSLRLRGPLARDFASTSAPFGWSVNVKGDREIDLTGKMDGVLVGRTAIGNPWVLNNVQDVTIGERLMIAVEHCKKFEELLPESKFFVMRKHLVGYASGFPGALELRKKLMMTNSANEVELMCEEWLKADID